MFGELVCYWKFKQEIVAMVAWWMWPAVIVLLGVLVLVDTIWMKKESFFTKERNQIYRWNFDTRLGMWSPT